VLKESLQKEKQVKNMVSERIKKTTKKLIKATTNESTTPKSNNFFEEKTSDISRKNQLDCLKSNDLINDDKAGTIISGRENISGLGKTSTIQSTGKLGVSGTFHNKERDFAVSQKNLIHAGAGSAVLSAEVSSAALAKSNNYIH
jgi:hypothetical protein